MMKYVIAVVVAVVLCPLAFGQGGDGYVFFAPGQLRGGGESQFAIHFGGGGRYISKSGAGLGVEVGMAGQKENFSDNYVGVFSPNGYYVFNSNEKVKPFITGGYTRIFGNNSGFNAGNFGGGVTYWAKPKIGALFEFRDHVFSVDNTRVQFWEVRFGLAFK
jgi:hypothetical protein